MIIARIESLILKQGLDDAVKRADAYVNAGADGIMIHSKEKDGREIFSGSPEAAKAPYFDGGPFLASFYPSGPALAASAFSCASSC